MITVGFKRATVATFGADGAVVNTHVVEGRATKGATTEAQITGLSPESKTAWGSDVGYYISQKGVGELKLELSILDLTFEMQNDVLGWKQDATLGFTAVGDQTEPPYTATVLESYNAENEPVAFAFFRGRYTKDEFGLKTRTNEAFEPEAEKLVMNCVANEGGLSYGMAVGAENVAKLKAYAIPQAA
ncbi:major tail protein [Listeria fleischmannii]|jgi:phi13 family phage major tail protein|uniref:major tail protein n=1 Tax=Listeria fleischmannii TaxID=1069827 RepID=UPI000254F9DC|nr:major tail protein [Listeria fleischmannii]EIA21424.1 major tail protein [Listeria fleischmannii subsp. coloradonensis]STY35252.1 phage major tail protein, phi13 family [Listeria fleischmannii subsp. coloradonensis]